MGSCGFQCDAPHQHVDPVSAYCDGMKCHIFCQWHGIPTWQYFNDKNKSATSRYRHNKIVKVYMVYISFYRLYLRYDSAVMRLRVWRAFKYACLVVCIVILFIFKPDINNARSDDLDLDSLNKEYRQLYSDNPTQGHHSRNIKKNIDHLGVKSERKSTQKYVKRRSVSMSPIGHGSCEFCPNITAIKVSDHARDICRSHSEDGVLVVLLILSHIQRRDTRDVVRTTWASASGNNTKSVRHVFIIGKPRSEYEESNFAKEEKRHRDMFMIDIPDEYRHLTYKVLGALKWVKEYCQNAKYIMKVDDDTFINTRKLPGFLQEQSDVQNTLIGSCHDGGSPIRETDSKWYVSRDLYPPDNYKPYCQGPGYIMPRQLARDIIRISSQVSFIPMEDAYVGLCLHKLGGKVKHLADFFLSRGLFQDKWISLCNFTKINTIVFHSIYAYELPTIHNGDCESEWKNKRVWMVLVFYLLASRLFGTLITWNMWNTSLEPHKNSADTWV